MTIDRQAFADKSIRAFAARNWTPALGGSCYYRKPGQPEAAELGCAIGVNIPNEAYCCWREGCNIRGQNVQALESIACGSSSDLQWLERFQKAHDRCDPLHFGYEPRITLEAHCKAFYEDTGLTWPSDLCSV